MIKPISLVMLPGLDGTGFLFHPLIKVLPENIQPITIKYPSDRALGYDELLPIVLKELPVDAPFVLLGESFSGPLALLVAATHPPMLKAIVLCVTFVSCPLPFIPHWTQLLVKPFLFQILKKIAKIAARSGANLSVAIAEALSSVQAKVLAHRVQEIITIDVTQQLAACDVPVLYLQGIHDVVVPKSNLERILNIKPDVQKMCINSSHMLLQSKPQQAAMAIKQFIGNCVH